MVSFLQLAAEKKTPFWVQLKYLGKTDKFAMLSNQFFVEDFFNNEKKINFL
jgi:hypothetical protein